MRRALVVSVFTFVLVGLAGAAEAHMVRYMSKHPLPRKVGHGFCYIDVPHFHDYGPSDPRMYRQVDGQYYFVGDPAPFEYDGPRYSFYGPHPIVDANVQFGAPTYCYLRGPHYHWYAPPPEAQFEMKGGAYWYVGNYDPSYYDDRPRYVAVNDAYTPIVYARPVVDVRVAPPAFHGEIVAVAPGVSAGVYIGAPPPPVVQVGVGVGIGGPPVVVEDRREVIVHDHYEHDHWDREHHDNGNHNGWRNHDRGDDDHDGWHGHGHEHDRDGWRGPPPPQHGGWRGPPPPPPQHGGGGGWRPAPAPAPQASSGGWRPQPGAPSNGGGHPGPGAPAQHHNNGAWRR
jgi:hypothetical protein